MGSAAPIEVSPYGDWPDTPREEVYQERSDYKNRLLGGGLHTYEVDRFMEVWDREHGI